MLQLHSKLCMAFNCSREAHVGPSLTIEGTSKEECVPHKLRVRSYLHPRLSVGSVKHSRAFLLPHSINQLLDPDKDYELEHDWRRGAPVRRTRRGGSSCLQKAVKSTSLAIGGHFMVEMASNKVWRPERGSRGTSILEVSHMRILGVKLGNPAIKSVELIGSQSLYGSISSISRVGGHDGEGTGALLSSENVVASSWAIEAPSTGYIVHFSLHHATIHQNAR